MQASAPCLSGLAGNRQGCTYASAAFVEGTSIPSLGRSWLPAASAAPVAEPGQRAGPLPDGDDHRRPRKGSGDDPADLLPPGRQRVLRLRLDVHDLGVPIGDDLILFRAGSYEGYLTYADVGSPSPATVQAFADAAVAKAEHGSTSPVPGTVSITSAPVRTAQTKLGTVAYRAVGSGPPLVLVMGYGGTMETWDPRLVNALAQRYRVVIFDNAGLGGTAALPAPLSIDAMANQTSALITALGLHRPAVLEKEAVAAQGHAIDAWWAGQDPAGARAASITAPALIADGAADQLDPAVNSRTLAGLIPGARLTLFPGAGHAFLFQDQSAFVTQVESFLA